MVYSIWFINDTFNGFQAARTDVHHSTSRCSNYMSPKYIFHPNMFFSVFTSHIIVIADCDDNIFLKASQGSEEQQKNWKLEFQNDFSSEREECHITRVGSKYPLNKWQMQKNQINQLHVEFQELNWCKKRNSNTTNSREKCNHLRYLIPRSICDAWRENRKCLKRK